jgi:CRP-like cAMP-binding protein
MEFISYLTSSDRERLMAEGDVVRLPVGEFLLRRGHRGGDIYLVESGRLEVIDMRQMPEVILDVLGSGRVVGEMSFVDESVRAADVRALDESTVRHWSRENLLRMLEGDTGLSARFYTALSAAAVGRLRQTDRSAVGLGGLQTMSSIGGVSAAVVEEAREIAGVARGVWSRVEQTHRATPNDDSVLKEVESALLNLVETIETWLGNVNSVVRAQEAGAVLRAELRHWLIRSRTGLIAVDRRGEQGARLSFLAHLLLNRAEGTDVVGERLDHGILSLPTPTGLRARLVTAVEVTASAIPNDRPAKITIVQPSCGALLARLLPRVVKHGATIQCLDGDSQTLAFVDAGLQARPVGVQIEMLHADLVGLSEGHATISIVPQDVIILNGLVDHLPARLVGTLLQWCGQQLAPGGRVVLTAMSQTSDVRAMEHLLGWPLVRRAPGDLLDLFAAAGLNASVIPIGMETPHGGLVIDADLSANGQV